MAGSTTQEQWDRLVEAHQSAQADWDATTQVLERLPVAEELYGQAGRDHDKAVADLDAAEDALLAAEPTTGAGIAYQFKVAAERYMEVEVEAKPSPHELPELGAIMRRVYATLLAVK